MVKSMNSQLVRNTYRFKWKENEKCNVSNFIITLGVRTTSILVVRLLIIHRLNGENVKDILLGNYPVTSVSCH